MYMADLPDELHHGPFRKSAECPVENRKSPAHARNSSCGLLRFPTPTFRARQLPSQAQDGWQNFRGIPRPDLRPCESRCWPIAQPGSTYMSLRAIPRYARDGASPTITRNRRFKKRLHSMFGTETWFSGTRSVVSASGNQSTTNDG